MKTRKKILITGATGFVGQNILHRIFQDRKDLEVYNYGRSPVNDPRVKNIFCDAATSDPSDIDIQFDYIINLLALSNDAFCQNFSYAEEINIEFTKKMLVFAKRQKHLKKFIHMSSILVYDGSAATPVSEDSKLYLDHNTYGFTKGISEYYVNSFRQKFGLPAIIFRLSNIYGPYQKIENSPFLITGKIVQAIDEGKIEVRSFIPKRDWIYSDDAAKAIILALDADYNGILNLGAGKGFSVKEIMSVISTELGVPLFSKEAATTGPLDFFCDISRIKKELGWKPKTDLKAGLKNTIRYIKEHKK